MDRLAGLNLKVEELEDGTLEISWNTNHPIAIEMGWNEWTAADWSDWLHREAQAVLDQHVDEQGDW